MVRRTGKTLNELKIELCAIAEEIESSCQYPEDPDILYEIIGNITNSRNLEELEYWASDNVERMIELLQSGPDGNDNEFLPPLQKFYNRTFFTFFSLELDRLQDQFNKK